MIHVSAQGIGFLRLILVLVVDQVLIDHILALPLPFLSIDLGVIQEFIT
jgi:hypothetical protein